MLSNKTTGFKHALTASYFSFACMMLIGLGGCAVKSPNIPPPTMGADENCAVVAHHRAQDAKWNGIQDNDAALVRDVAYSSCIAEKKKTQFVSNLPSP